MVCKSYCEQCPETITRSVMTTFTLRVMGQVGNLPYGYSISSVYESAPIDWPGLVCS